jgi:hypothetical protein
MGVSSWKRKRPSRQAEKAVKDRIGGEALAQIGTDILCSADLGRKVFPHVGGGGPSAQHGVKRLIPSEM